MRRIAICFLAIVAIALGGCAREAAREEAHGIQVVATIFPPYDFARELVKDTEARVTMLIKPGVESHTFDPSPSDMRLIRDADLFLCIGGHDEAWVDALLESPDAARGQTVKLIDCVETLEEQHDHGETHEEEGVDEHIWTSPRNAKRMAQAIRDALIQVDPEQTEVYNRNYEDYAARLDALDAQFLAAVEHGARREIVFGDRFPFLYFAQAYGLEWDAAFDSCSSEAEPSAADVARLIEKIKTDRIPVVYHIEQGSVRTAQAIAQEAGVRTQMMHSCHNLTTKEFSGGETYLSLMENNVEALIQGLS